jgi:Cu/Ag efflux pump CusA
LLTRGIRTPHPAYLTLAVLALAGVATIPLIKQSPVPVLKETDFLVDLDGPPGTSLPEMERITAQASTELRAIPGVRRVSGQVGRAVLGDQVVNPESSQLWVSLAGSADYDKTVASIKNVVRGYPGIDTDVLTYSQSRFKEVRTGADEPVVVRLFGADLDVLRQKAGDVTRALGDVRGLTNIHADLPAVQPTLQVDVDLEAAKAAGIKPGDIRRAATTLLSGLVVGNTFEEQKVFEVVVWGTPAIRQNLTTVRDLQIDKPGGGHVRLGDVAKVDVKPAPNVIERDDVSRLVDVTAGVRGRDRDAVLADVRHRLENVEFPLEYHYELVGNYTDRQVVQRRLLWAAIAAAVLILLLLQATFRNWRLAALLFVTLPIALVGGALSVLVDGRTLELGSLVGLLTVFGVAVRHGVALIHRYQQLERDGHDVSGPELVARGARERLAPMLTGAVATGLFFAPFLFLGDLPGHEIVTPLAGVVLGGLVTTLVLTLFLLPALYLRFAYGRSVGEELDLRELWEVEVDVTDAASEPLAATRS